MKDPSLEGASQPILTRKQVVVGGLASAGVLLGTRLGVSDALAADWKYTDDKSQKIIKPSVPKRIVAYNEAAVALYNFGITPVGVFGTTPKQDPALAGLPWDKIEEVGAVYGEIALEKLVALKPDLIVSVWYPPPLDAVPFGFKDKAQLYTVKAIAPVLHVNAHVVASRGLQKFARLAGALGANLKAQAVVDAKTRYEKSLELVKAQAAKKGNLKILAFSYFNGTVYIAKPRDHSDLSLFKSLGANIIVPSTEAAYWEVLSVEQLGKYAHDVLLYDARPFATPRADLMKIPAITSLPSVKAGQFIPWHVGAPLDYSTYAKNLTAFSGVLKHGKIIS